MYRFVSLKFTYQTIKLRTNDITFLKKNYKKFNSKLLKNKNSFNLHRSNEINILQKFPAKDTKKSKTFNKIFQEKKIPKERS